METRPPCHMIIRFLKMIERQGILNEAFSPKTAAGSLVLKVDAMKVLCEDFHFGNWLLRDMDGFRIELIEALVLANVISSVSEPVWVRLESVPLPLRYDLNFALTQPCTLVRFSGLVARLSCIKQRVYSRRLRCPHCNAISETLEGSARTLCRCAVIDGEVEEDLSARRLVPTQTIYIAPIQSASGQNAFGGISYVMVDVDDDLAGVCCLGDVVEISGTKKTRPTDVGRITRPHGYLFAKIEVQCNNLSVVSPWNVFLSAPRSCSAGGSPFFGNHVLHSLCEALGEVCSQQLPPSLGIVLLLSIVMVGSPRTQATRNQIHLLITCDGYDPGAVRLLQEVANLIAPHSLTHSEAAGAMRCCVTNGGDESSCDVTVSGNAITSARNGILVMDTTQIKKGNKAYITDCLGRASIQPHPADEFIIPMTATVWGSHCIHGAKPQKLGTKRSSSNVGVLGMELGEGFLSDIDVVVPYSMRVDPLYDSMAVERILEIDEDEASSEKPAETCVWRLRQHLSLVCQKPCPTLSEHAKDLMQRYYMSVRNSGEEDCQVHASILPSLMRLAKASAKLCGRSQVQESPDVGIAIKLVEETMVAKEVYSRPRPLLLSMDSVVENSQAMSIDQELDCLHSAISKTLGKEIWMENEE